MKINNKLLDILIYFIFIILVLIDFIKCFLVGNSLFITLSFLPLLIFIIYAFIRSKGFLTIDQMLYVFMFIFCYYTPLHQYIENSNIHKFTNYTTSDYLYANFIVFLFFSIYLIIRKYSNINTKQSIKILKINTLSLFILMLLCIASLIWLKTNNVLFSMSESVNNNTRESFTIILTKIIRFIPVSSVLLLLVAIAKKQLSCNTRLNYFFIFIIFFVFLIIFFPLNGVISRYLLFGTYLMILHTIFESSHHKSYIIVAAFIGFYLLFPAFNFFKYNSISNIKYFKLGGFEASYIDYDAYQMLMQTFHYTNENGLLFGKNIISALFCMIPRSIWKNKLVHSGALIANSYNANFNNLSCPIFAEFYLSFGLFGVIFFTIIFAKFINYLESINKSNNSYCKIIYSISAGMVISIMRGALLPMMSFWFSLMISLSLCAFVCIICVKKKGNIK